jgi:hypothetical protein
MLIVNHAPLREQIKSSYTGEELRRLRAFL